MSEREAIARIIDPEAFQPHNDVPSFPNDCCVRRDSCSCFRWPENALSKADAILALSAAPSPVDGGEGSSNASRAAMGPLPHVATEAEPSGPWRCFQCDELFTEARAAAEHFTGNTSYPPACVRQLQDGERWAHAEIARLEAHARHMYCLKSALEKELSFRAGSAAVEDVYARVRNASPLPLPEPGEGNAAVADSAATREPISRAATGALQAEKED